MEFTESDVVYSSACLMELKVPKHFVSQEHFNVALSLMGVPSILPELLQLFSCTIYRFLPPDILIKVGCFELGKIYYIYCSY